VHCPTFSSFQCNNGSTILARCSWALPYDFVPFQPTQYTETTTNIDRLKMDFECRLIKCLQTPLSLIFRTKPTKAEGPLVPFYILIRIHQRLWIDKPPQQHSAMKQETDDVRVSASSLHVQSQYGSPQAPQSWSMTKKLFHTVIPCLYAFLVYVKDVRTSES
jgi:hypothetical protein